MPGQTTNLGQVAAIWINATAPSNKKLIWYDTVNRTHRVYDTFAQQWVALNPEIITTATLAQLRSTAESTGLPIGKFYNVTDVNAIGIAVTSTKIWYSDLHNNYIINDLTSMLVYFPNSENLYIDGTKGVFNASTGRLEFNFIEVNNSENLNTNGDYIVMRRFSNGAWSWIKSKISAFISVVSGNSITWNKGFYFNFNSAINSIKNVSGGIVGKNEYDTAIQSLQQDIANTALQNQNFATQTKNYTDNKTADNEIYNKQLPDNLDVPLSPSDTPSVGWSLKTILGQIYGWINKLKTGNNINVGTGFRPAGVSGEVNAGDSVMNAIQKIVYKLKNSITDSVSLPPDFDSTDPSYADSYPIANDNLTTSVGKLTYGLRELVERPYINEDTWHVGADMNWIIRNNTLFIHLHIDYSNRTPAFKLKETHNSIYLMDSGGVNPTSVMVLGESFEDYLNCFDKIPFSYEYIDSSSGSDVNKKQKYIPLIFYRDQTQWAALEKDIVTVSGDNIDIFTHLEGTLGLCIEYFEDSLGEITFDKAFIGFEAHSKLGNIYSYDRFAITDLKPQTVSIPLSF